MDLHQKEEDDAELDMKLTSSFIRRPIQHSHDTNTRQVKRVTARKPMQYDKLLLPPLPRGRRFAAIIGWCCFFNMVLKDPSLSLRSLTNDSN